MEPSDEWTELEIYHPIWIKSINILVKAPHETIQPIMEGVKPAAMLLVQSGTGKKELAEYYTNIFIEAGFEVRIRPYFQTYSYLLK